MSKTVYLDKLYTKPEVAKQCIDFIKEYIDISNYTIVEPSAGDGAFSNQLPGCIALDIEPEHPSITRQDWFQYNKSLENHIVIGNPPYGKRNNLSIKFFNHAAGLGAEYICFLVMRSFSNYSNVKNINKNYVLVKSKNLEPNSFLVNGKEYVCRKINDEIFGINCQFQIWKKTGEKRVDIKPPSKSSDFEIVRVTNKSRKKLDWYKANYKYAVRGSGFYTDFYIKLSEQQQTNSDILYINPKTAQAEDILLRIDYFALSRSTAMIPFITMSGIVEEYEKIKNLNGKQTTR